MPALRVFIPYFGGKFMRAKYYPPPKHGRIIEPFAGAAGYSVRYADRDVLLIDKSHYICGAWDFLIHAPASEIRALPLMVPGDDVQDLPIPDEAKWLLGFWINQGSTMPKRTMGRASNRKFGTWGEAPRERLAEQVEHIRHWKIQQGDYFLAPDARATWFIDPPYQDQGKQYQHQIDDFDRLASWCRQRQGQVLVCESEGATWLPFEPVTTVVGSTHRKTTEVLWYVENKGADNMSTAKKIEISEEAKSLTAVGSERADSFLELIEDTDLLGEDDYEAAGVMLKDIKRQAKELKNARTEITGPMNQALEATRKLFRAPLKVLDKAERLLKSKMADYTTRLEEEREQALAEAGAASLEGDEDTAVYAMQAAAKAKAPTVAGISMQDVWDYEIEDFDKVPREFLCVDDDLVKAAIKEHKSATNIPGIRVFSKKSVRARA